jgi:hypothetical protein
MDRELRAIYRNQFYKNVRGFLINERALNCGYITDEEFIELSGDAVNEFHESLKETSCV